MKTLVIYYSLQGNTKCIAEAIADKMDGDLESVQTREKIKASEFMDYYWGGKKEHPQQKIPIRPLEHDPSDYDLIIIGTPVWAWAPAPPIYSYLVDNDIKGKKIALFSCSEGETGKTFKKMEQLLKGNRIVAKEEFVNPEKDRGGTCEIKAASWADSLIKQMFSN